MYGDIQNVNYRTVINSLSIQDQLVVWSWVLGRYVDLNVSITSPFRMDKNPSCWLREYNGIVLFTDFADRVRNRYTCIHAVADLETCGLNKAAQMIDAALEFNKPLRGSLNTLVGKKVTHNCKSTLFFVPFMYDGKPVFTKQGAEYWKKRYAKKHELQNCYNVSHFYLNGDLIIPQQPCFAYTVEARCKIYQPYNKKQKWLSNTTHDDKFIFEQFSNVCVITSSYKDCLPWYRYTNYNVHAFQSETTIPTDIDYTQYEYIVINYDGDTAGIKGAYQLLDTLKYKYAKLFFFPLNLGKDADEVLVRVGEDEFKKLIQNV